MFLDVLRRNLLVGYTRSGTTMFRGQAAPPYLPNFRDNCSWTAISLNMCQAGCHETSITTNKRWATSQKSQGLKFSSIGDLHGKNYDFSLPQNRSYRAMYIKCLFSLIFLIFFSRWTKGEFASDSIKRGSNLMWKALFSPKLECYLYSLVNHSQISWKSLHPCSNCYIHNTWRI